VTLKGVRMGGRGIFYIQCSHGLPLSAELTLPYHHYHKLILMTWEPGFVEIQGRRYGLG
jgi:hypothetical protein